MQASSRLQLAPIGLALLGLIALCLCGSLLRRESLAPQPRQGRDRIQVYAYRDWQSTTYTLHPGDQYWIEAGGEWMYSPEVGFHGPQGSPHHWSPDSYPLPGMAGGALLGRIGENGLPFYIGAGTAAKADRGGMLYLRIDDDRLGDNEGFLEVDIGVTSGAEAQPDAQPGLLTPEAPYRPGTEEPVY